MCNESAIRHCKFCKIVEGVGLNEHLGVGKAIGFSRTSTRFGSLFSSCSFLVRLIGAASILCGFYSSAAFTHDVTVSKAIDMVHR